MDAAEMRRRLEAARVARLATADSDGRPHVVPIAFCIDGDTMYFAVDAKPKRTSDLKRLRNIAANPRVAVLVDHYEEGWTRLWWVRAEGTARVLDDRATTDKALQALAEKYEQYHATPPPGPVVAISIARITGWEAGGNPSC
jgi:PPOX class probable F420-dependent enzyme